MLVKQPPQHPWAGLGTSLSALDLVCDAVCSPVAVGTESCPRHHWSHTSSSVCKNSRFHHLQECGSGWESRNSFQFGKTRLSFPFSDKWQVEYHLISNAVPQTVVKTISFLSIVSVTLLYLKMLIAALFLFSNYDNKEFSNDRTKASLWQLLQRNEKSQKQGELHYKEWP